jgi:hypothetical protein
LGFLEDRTSIYAGIKRLRLGLNMGPLMDLGSAEDCHFEAIAYQKFCDAASSLLKLEHLHFHLRYFLDHLTELGARQGILVFLQHTMKLEVSKSFTLSIEWVGNTLDFDDQELEDEARELNDKHFDTIRNFMMPRSLLPDLPTHPQTEMKQYLADRLRVVPAVELEVDDWEENCRDIEIWMRQGL